jgi:hypothetical protein
MPRREYKTVSIGPSRVLGVKFQRPGEEGVGDVGATHRQAGMAGIGPLYTFKGKDSDGIDGKFFEGGCIARVGLGHGWLPE